jgi:signal transduction histidine kinase
MKNNRAFGGQRTVTVMAALVFLLGATVLLGWAINVDVLKSIMPDWVTMKANSALGMALCGIALGLTGVSGRAARLTALAAAAILIVVGAVTLVEYFFGTSLAIDDMLFRDNSVPIGNSLPARMSPLAAYCFLLSGIALEVAASPGLRRRWMPFVAAIGSTLMAVGAVALLGYAIDGLVNVQWWNYTGLALHTAIGFGLLGYGIMCLVARSGELVWALRRNTTWGFVVGMITLLTSAGISYHFTALLESSSQWVGHTQDALRELQGISTSNLAMQSALRGYLISGEPVYIEDIGRAKVSLKGHFGSVRERTMDNQKQQLRLDNFQPKLIEEIGFIDQTVELYKTNGREAALEYFNGGAGLKIAAAFRTTVREMRDDELKLLAVRSEAAEVAERTAFLVLPLGTFLSLALLSVGLFFLNAGAHERDKAEQRLQVSFREIEQMKNDLEVRVAERTRQLEDSNRELEAFSYSVSHDLRAPLRAVDGFSQAVLEDFGPSIPLEGHRQLNVIRAATQKMGDLIDDLLTFSRLSRQSLSLRPVQTEALVKSVLTDLKGQMAGRDVKVTVGPLPVCESDPALLKQVWVNLLSNALKYTSKLEHATVEVGCIDQKGGQVFFVRDNGTGFDMKYSDKLFGVFQRLHRTDEYEGTGVGLAIVQRIIHRHGGRVWADAAPDAGATFFFTLANPPAL